MMLRMLRAFGRSEEGVGVVTALMVVFIVFTLGATWHAISLHELDEVTFDRHRTQSVHAAEAGAREAMYVLSHDSAARSQIATSGEYTSGVTGSQCDLTVITSNGSTVGQYWYRVTDPTPADPDDLRYFIESWGWAPHSQARQANLKKVELDVRLVPYGGSFQYALFVGTQGLAGAQRKVIYGDVYTGRNATIEQYTELNPNDGGYPGNGDMRVYGNLSIANNLVVAGTMTVNDYITQTSGSDATIGELMGVKDPPNGGGNPAEDTLLRKVAVAGTMRFTNGRSYATAAPNQVTAGGGIVHTATNLVEVPFEPLPDFNWADVGPPYDPISTWTSWADFQTWVSANQSALTGAHYVQGGGSVTWNLNFHTFADDFLLVVDGNVTLAGSPSSSATDPITLTVVGNSPTSNVATGSPVLVTSENLWLLVYSRGTGSIGLPSVIYGALYADKGVSGTNLEIHFRPPTSDIGFVWDPSVAEGFVPEPGVWREAAPGALPCTAP